MRHLFLLEAVIIMGLSPAIAKEVKLDFVPSQEVAIEIAIALWTPLYGKERIDRFHPFHGTLERGHWSITGTVPEGTRGGGNTRRAEGPTL